MLDYLLEAFVTLFVTVDPLGLAPLFIGLTGGMSAADRRHVALRATGIATAILVAFALFGGKLLMLMGISLPAFRIAGGLLLFSTAFQMVFSQKEPRDKSDADRAVTLDHIRDIAAFPLAIPLLAGPGAISAAILAASKAPSVPAYGAFVGLIILVMAISLVVFLAAGPIDRRIGETGRIVVGRLLGLLLAALAVQFVADGVKAILAG
ncbi:MAG: MarC family protein [Hyphomicrobiales bacterium]|nr:MarC family protein [Hyphomicrobiales bacterium]